MSRVEQRMRASIQWMWRHSLAHLAEPHIAAPQMIPLTERSNNVLRYLWSAIRAGAPWSTGCMVLTTLTGTVCNVGQSFLLGQITGQALEGKQLILLLVALMTLWLLAPLMQALHNLARLYASQNLRITVTDHLTARLMYARLQQVASNAVGNLVERIELTSANLPSIVCTISDTIVKLLSVTILVSIVLAGVSMSLALIASIWMLTAMMLSSYLACTGMKIVEDASDAHAKVIADLAEIVSNIPLIRSFTAQIMERLRFGIALQADLYACRRVRSYWVFVLLAEAIYKWLFGLIITIYSVQQYTAGSLTLPQLITLCSLVVALSWHFESVAFHFVELFEALGVLRSGLRELSAIDVDLIQINQPLPHPGSIVFNNVSASYGYNKVLCDISLNIAPGSKVGIVGPSGSGKSTLLAVLRGELMPDHGHVRLHGLTLEDCSSTTLARASSEAVQNALMFNRSVRENVADSATEQNQQSLNKVLSAAQARRLVDRLPQQLDTHVGERGSLLSTGERQRLSIARALLKQAPLLILDEATSSIDTISEASIVNHLIHQMPERTVIVVTHRVTVLERFDHIIVMDKGRIVDSGSPQELLVRNVLFQRLKNHQNDLDGNSSFS